MDKAVEVVITEYQARADSERTLMCELSPEEMSRRRDEMLLPIGRATATLLNLFIKEGKFRRILEIGTSYGYSVVWLAEAARATGGKVITLELQPAKTEYARTQIARAGLADYVEFVIGDALDSLKGLNGPFDFVLIDLWKDLYVPVFGLVHPKLAPGAIVVADNMTYPESARPHAQVYRKHVRAARDMTSVLLPVGNGIEVSRRRNEDLETL